MAPINLIIHVGYSRTATTFLQTFVFPRLKGVKYLGRYADGGCHPAIVAFRDDFFNKVSGNYELKVRSFAQQVAKAIGSDAEQNVLISMEEFSDRDSFIFGRNINYFTSTEYNLFRIQSLANALEKELQLRIKIHFLVVIREQKSWLKSFYSSQYELLKRNHAKFKLINTFNKFIEFGLKSPYDDWLGSLHYQSELKKYSTVVDSSISTLVYEDFLLSRPKFLKNLFSVIGTDSSPSDIIEINPVNAAVKQGAEYVYVENNAFGRCLELFSRHTSEAKKVLPRPIIQALKPLSKKSQIIEFSHENASEIDRLYREGNRRLEILLGRNLAAYGY